MKARFLARFLRQLGLFITILALSACGRSSDNERPGSPIGSSYKGPECTGTPNVLKVSGTVDGKAVAQELPLTSYEYNGGEQTDNEGFLIVKKDKLELLAIDFPSSEVTSDLGEASAKGQLTLATNQVYSNCMETDAYPSTIFIDQSAGFFRFILRKLNMNTNPCVGSALSGTLEGCFIKAG